MQFEKYEEQSMKNLTNNSTIALHVNWNSRKLNECGYLKIIYCSHYVLKNVIFLLSHLFPFSCLYSFVIREINAQRTLRLTAFLMIKIQHCCTASYFIHLAIPTTFLYFILKNSLDSDLVDNITLMHNNLWLNKKNEKFFDAIKVAWRISCLFF